MSETGQRWAVILHRDASKSLKRLPKHIAKRVDQILIILADNPYLQSSIKMVGYDNRYRVRVGDWRIVYEVYNDELIVLVVRISPRGSAYED